MEMKEGFKELELAVMNKLLQGQESVLVNLYDQFNRASVDSREITSAGFFLKFSLPENVFNLGEKVSNIKANFCFGDVEANIKGLKNGAGFLLWIKNGKLDILEGYSYEEKWPKEIEEFQLSYHFSPRNIALLRKQWQISSII